MTEKDYMLYGTKVLNLKTQEIGLLICIWKNKFADAEIDFATCVDRQGKRYNPEGRYEPPSSPWHRCEG